MNAQDRVVKAVEQRGYYNKFDGVPWSKDELIARHTAKLAEELAELSAHVRQYGDDPTAHWELDLEAAGRDARIQFDNRGSWEWVELRDKDAIRSELADVVVVALSMANVLDFDVVQMAVEKAESDIDRGVRGG